MNQICRYNKATDRCPVVPDQAIRLGASLDLGKVPSTVGFDAMRFNGIDNPADIIGRPYDNFEAMRLQSGVLDAGRAAKQAENDAAAAAAASAAAAAAPASPQE